MSRNDWKENVWEIELLIYLKKEGLISSKIDFKKMLKIAELKNRKGITERTIDDLNERICNWRECIVNDTNRLEAEEKELEKILQAEKDAKKK